MQLSYSDLKGSVSPPASKSISHRALILSSIARHGSTISNLLNSMDVYATKSGIESMGAIFEENNDILQFTTNISHGNKSIDCKNSGTTLRLLTGIASLFKEKSTLFGDESLNNRPMSGIINPLNQLGIKIKHDNFTAPVTIQGPLKAGDLNCSIDKARSSQFISSLVILGFARNDGNGLSITINGPILSKPYLDLTIKMIENIGGNIEIDDNNYIITARELKSNNYIIPTDYSSAAFFIAAGSFQNNSITINGLDNSLPQADEKIIKIIAEMGAEIKYDQDSITVSYNELNGMEIDLHDAPDLFPILCVVGSQAKGTTILKGAEHLKFKETDRIAAMTTELKKMGVDITATNDGAIIHQSIIKGGCLINPHGDHRIAMATAIAATRSKKQVEISNPDCVKVSYPSFFNDLDHLIYK